MQAGAAALLVRQTNIMWAGWAAAYSFYMSLPPQRAAESVLQHTLRHASRHVAQLAVWACLAAGFAAFVVDNGGVALGDRANHAAVFHWAQLGYVLDALGVYVVVEGVAAVARCGVRGAAAAAVGWCRGQSRVAVVAVAAAILADGVLGAHYTYAHPFLLADNRHYTFYLWGRVLARYPVLWWAAAVLHVAVVVRLLSAFPSPALAVAWLAATAAAVVPSPLLEPRYYITPVLVAVLTSSLLRQHRGGGGSSGWPLALVLVAAGQVAVCAAALALFIVRPFTAPDGSVGRFMW